MPDSLGESRPCVLVAEPEAVTRELLERSLHLAGFATLAAPTGERALLLLRERRTAIDWLVCSKSLPGLVDGHILADEFHSHHPARAVLVGTDLVEGAPHQHTLAAGPSPVEIAATVKAWHDANRPVDGPAPVSHALAA